MCHPTRRLSGTSFENADEVEIVDLTIMYLICEQPDKHKAQALAQ